MDMKIDFFTLFYVMLGVYGGVISIEYHFGDRIIGTGRLEKTQGTELGYPRIFERKRPTSLPEYTPDDLPLRVNPFYGFGDGVQLPNRRFLVSPNDGSSLEVVLGEEKFEGVYDPRSGEQEYERGMAIKVIGDGWRVLSRKLRGVRDNESITDAIKAGEGIYFSQARNVLLDYVGKHETKEIADILLKEMYLGHITNIGIRRNGLVKQDRSVIYARNRNDGTIEYSFDGRDVHYVKLDSIEAANELFKDVVKVLKLDVKYSPNLLEVISLGGGEIKVVWEDGGCRTVGVISPDGKTDYAHLDSDPESIHGELLAEIR